MPVLTRRDFLRNSAVAAAGTLMLPVLTKGWYSLAAAEAPGYFERELRITDALCRKVLAEATAANLAPAGLIRSPLTGPAGNIEFLAWLCLGAIPADELTMTSWLDACAPDDPSSGSPAVYPGGKET